MPVDSNRLSELRKRKRLTLDKLANEAKLSRRQIVRLEHDAEAAGKARDRTVMLLADALNVEPAVLTGEAPLPAPDPSLQGERGVPRQVSALLRPEASLACTLVERRYGVSRTTLFNAAPLMFVLLAEGSFVWRREKAKEANEAAGHLRKLGLGSSEFSIAAQKAEDGAAGEWNSIEERNLFGEDLFENAEWDEGYDRFSHNPFADYLRNLATKIDDPDIVQIVEDSIHDRGPLKNFPEFTLCYGDLDRFTGGDERLNFVLRMGWLRIDHVPEEFETDEAVDQRRAWLEEQYESQLPEEVKEGTEKLLALRINPAETEEMEAAQ